MKAPKLECDLRTGWVWWKGQRCFRLAEIHLREALDDLLLSAADGDAVIHEVIHEKETA